MSTDSNTFTGRMAFRMANSGTTEQAETFVYDRHSFRDAYRFKSLGQLSINNTDMTTVCLTNFIILAFVSGQGKCLWSHNCSITTVYRQEQNHIYVRYALVFMSVTLTKTKTFQNRGPNTSLRWKNLVSAILIFRS